MARLTFDQALQLAIDHHNAGALDQAEQIYHQILSQNPEHHVAIQLLGVIAGQRGQLDTAIDLIGRAIALHPGDASYHINLSKFLRDRGMRKEAVNAARCALQLQAQSPQAWLNLAGGLFDLGRDSEAIAAFRQALQCDPSFAQAHVSLAEALLARGGDGDIEDAEDHCRRAVTIDPNYGEAWNDLANLLNGRRSFEAAEEAAQKAIRLAPGSAPAHNNLAIARQHQGKYERAIAAYGESMRLRAGNPADRKNVGIAHANLGKLFIELGRMDEAIATLREAITLQPGLVDAHSGLIFAMHLHPDFDITAIGRELRAWNLRHAEPLKPTLSPHENARDPGRTLRIGYVSPDFVNHPIGRFIHPVLQNADRAQFENYCFSDVPNPDAMTRRLQQEATHWRNTRGTSDETVDRQIRADGIDILVDLTAHTRLNRLLVFARKPAPVQVTYLAYCSSTGLDTIDYRISDPFLDPVDSDLSGYSEETIRLPETYWCYQPHYELQKDVSTIAELPALRNGHVTFGSLNASSKLSISTLQTWARILQLTPGSRMIVHALEGMPRERIGGIFSAAGISADRIDFFSHLPVSEYFRQFAEIDVALDPFPYAGGTTTCDSLWMGVPVVTLAGCTAVGRGGVSILSNVHIPELVSRDREQYVRIALDLAADFPRLRHYRQTLRQRMEASPLMNAQRFTRAIEAIYRQIWTRCCATAGR